MSQKLLIVESPAKAKTIEKYLGKDFKVKSSFGHIRDLEKGNKGIDIEQNFNPHYVVSPEKIKVVNELKEALKIADEVWLATDEDREGEAISWHLCEVLNLDKYTTKRIVFREITKNAIQNAVNNPRLLDLNLVNAQQARRVLDRLVGFELSEILWKKIKGQLSAGRVQSVTVKLVVDREREISTFETASSFKVKGEFDIIDPIRKNVTLHTEGQDKFSTKPEAHAFLTKCIGATYKVQNITIKPGFRKPAPPFITSTLQQEASRKLGFSVKRTMIAAQKLYEAGNISYMRTDSTQLSETAIQDISQTIEKNFGSNYVEIRRYKTKNQSAQEAHEAIRPTYMSNFSVTSDKDQEKLYDLIWKRTIASQMANAILEKTEVDISISTIKNYNLKAFGEIIKFEGFLKVYFESSDDQDEELLQGILPKMEIGQVLDLKILKAIERFSKPPSRFSEASLVKKMEEIGIGRPSTYAPTISKIMEENRGYVIKDSREGEKREYLELTLLGQHIEEIKKSENIGSTKNQLYPTDMGIIVTDFLTQNFDSIMDYNFTAKIEEEFDTIAEGKLIWTNMLSSFYKPFHEHVEQITSSAERATGERILGKYGPKQRSIFARISRFGKPIIQIGKLEELDENEKPLFANFRVGQTIEKITLEEALKLFELPKELGIYLESTVIVNTGRFGPYIKFNDHFISIPKNEDPFEIELERAIELIEQKLETEKPVGYYEDHPVTKGKGRFGPFIKWKDFFINVNPKKYDFQDLSQSDINELVSQKVEKESNRFIKNWEDEKISIENGRWGPFIRFNKKMLKLEKNENNEKYSEDELKNINLDVIKKMILNQFPSAFDKKSVAKKAPKKKTK